MSQFVYVAVDSHGQETRGTVSVGSQSEAIRRIKELGFFPTKVAAAGKAGKDRRKPSTRSRSADSPTAPNKLVQKLNISLPFLQGRVKSKTLTAFTRQLATLIDAGMPLLHGLRILSEEETNPRLRRVTEEIMVAIEGGGSLSEGLLQHPKVFNKLYVNMVKAGELGGVLDIVLHRLAEFLEKAERIKGKVVSGMFYPVAVLVVATAIMGALMVYVVPKFQEIFADLMNGAPLPAFTTIVLGISYTIKNHFLMTLGCLVAGVIAFKLLARTFIGRRLTDRMKLKAPLLGPVIRKVSISRFARTFGTLISSGVPVLQALTIVRETAGNAIVADAVQDVHDAVKEGGAISPPLRASGIFPGTVVGMIDIGEQSGALPEMLGKIADNYDEEVDNAIAGMISLLEPIMIVILAVVVGSIVIAMFLPIIEVMNDGF